MNASRMDRIDFLKLVVALVLLAILIFLLLRPPAAVPVAAGVTAAPPATQVAAQVTAAPPATQAVEVQPTAPLPATKPATEPATEAAAAAETASPVPASEEAAATTEAATATEIAAATEAPASTEALASTEAPAATEQATAAGKPLPPFPKSPVVLTLLTDSKQLARPDGSPAYTLDEQAWAWVPYIPADLSAKLPPDAKPVSGPKEWTVRAANGKIFYSWDPENLTWVPYIPPEITAKLPPDARPASGPDGWIIRSADGATLYIWDPGTSAWKPEAQQAAAAGPVDCPGALPARLSPGMTARVTTNLNLRSSPGIETNLVRTSAGNSLLVITGQPKCVPYQGKAYLWWPIKAPDGQEGWSAEGSLTGKFYFLEPVK